jgi:hypothetical protein
VLGGACIHFQCGRSSVQSDAALFGWLQREMQESLPPANFLGRCDVASLAPGVQLGIFCRIAHGAGGLWLALHQQLALQNPLTWKVMHMSKPLSILGRGCPAAVAPDKTSQTTGLRSLKLVNLAALRSKLIAAELRAFLECLVPCLECLVQPASREQDP